MYWRPWVEALVCWALVLAFFGVVVYLGIRTFDAIEPVQDFSRRDFGGGVIVGWATAIIVAWSPDAVRGLRRIFR